MTEGFKNVNLGNVYPKPSMATLQFIDQQDMELMCKYSKESLTLIVALHELLGHGTGKLFTKNIETGEINFPADAKNPFTGEPITTHYTSNETWGQKFGRMHSGYEECRADVVALHLIHFEEVYEIFYADRTKEEWNDIYYVCWLDMIYGAIKGLQFFDTEKQIWGQAHVWASWAIFEVVRQYDSDIIRIEFVQGDDGQDSFTLKLNRDKLRTVGFKAIDEFLHKLHVYKSIGDFETAEKFFNSYSQVNETMLKVRDIVIARRKPRRLELQPGLRNADGKISYVGYEENHSGIVQSYIERFEEFMKNSDYTAVEMTAREWYPYVEMWRHPL